MSQSKSYGQSASIETLESRMFLSASPLASAHRLIEPAKVKATIPSLAGTAYTGFAVLPTITNINFVVESETKTGHLVASGQVGLQIFPTFTGTVNIKRKIAFHIKFGKTTITLTGTVSPTLSAIAGKMTETGPGTHLHGTFNIATYS